MNTRAANENGFGRGQVVVHAHMAPAGRYPYLLYLPDGYRPKLRYPLYVMLHGCDTSAAQQMQVNGLNPLADREGFVVLYPDVTTSHVRQCWRAALGSRKARERGAGGDADAVAAMVQTVIERYAIDAHRVYFMGMSAGGFQATATAWAYPELAAAVAVVAGGGYGMDFASTSLDDSALPGLVQCARAALGDLAEVTPFLAIGGGKDALRLGSNEAPGGCARLAFRQWRQLAEEIARERGESLFGERAVQCCRGAIPGGRRWIRETYVTRDGRAIGEYWNIVDMGHYWPGGLDDPVYARFTDPEAPSGAEISWAFFRRFARSGGAQTDRERNR